MLVDLVKSLSKEEVRNFSIYLSRIQKSGEGSNKLSALFEAIRAGKNIEGDWYEQLYDNKNAFYRLKNRLQEEIERSIVMLKSHNDADNKIYSFMSLAKLFVNKNENELALKYFHKAEKLCLEIENTSMLKVVYEEIISLCSSYSKINPIHYINLLNQLEEENDELRDLNRLTASINYKLRQTNFSGKDEVLLKELQEIISNLNLDQQFISNQKVQLKINEVVRNILLQQKDFDGLILFLQNSLERFEQEKLFNKHNHDKKIIMYTWWVNALSKVKAFEKAIKVSEKLKKTLDQYDGLYKDKYIWTYYQSLVINYTYSNQVNKAIDLLTKLKGENKLRGEIFYDVFIYLNLTTLYFCKSEFSNSLKSLQHIIIKDVYDRLEAGMKLNVSIVEAIIHFEKGNFEFVVFKINEVRKKFKLQLKEEYFKKEQSFLKILKDLASLGKEPLSDKVNLKIEDFKKSFFELEVGSNEAINYLAYLDSKQKNKPYYAYLLKVVKNHPV